MFYFTCRTLPLLLLGGFVVPGVRHVIGIEIKTEKEVVAVNGTDVKLSCTFSSSHPVSPDTVSVSWHFRPLDSGSEESVFYYHDTPYPPTFGRFKDHVMWSGDVMRKDASITLQEVNPTFNGTYSCQVKNLPDVHGTHGEISLKVVDKVSLSEISLLAILIGGACGAALVFLSIFVAVKFCRKRKREHDLELPESKDPTVW